jgi:hypothetical protein
LYSKKIKGHESNISKWRKKKPQAASARKIGQSKLKIRMMKGMIILFTL